MNSGKLITGLITGAMMGGAVSMMMTDSRAKQMKEAKKRVGKTIKTVGEVIDSFL